MKIIIIGAVVTLLCALSANSEVSIESSNNTTGSTLAIQSHIRNIFKIPNGTEDKIPTTPGDNSHYVEGQSRYIWIPDGEGVPHLEDLHAPLNEEILNTVRTTDINQYWLFTRQNPNVSQVIVFGDSDSITNSNFNASRPLKAIVHGWKSSGTSEINRLITPAFLSVLDANVIVVDWSTLADYNYITASNGVPRVGEYLGNFLFWLTDATGTDWNKVHIVGFSLGAHVVGNAGRTTGNRPARVTGLDPAGPLWKEHSEALIASDGKYVEAIHTDGGVLGLLDRICQSDFYPNGGSTPQPGCSIFSTCSHSRSYHLFASTIRTDHLVGRWCNDLYEAKQVVCNGKKLHMGNAVLDKKGEGIYGLTTGSKWPF